MTRILLCGCNGKMGRVIARCVKERDDCEIVAGVDLNTDGCEFPVFTSIADCTVPVDAVIDFSHPSCLAPMLEYCRKNKIPTVIATTGLSKEQVSTIHAAATVIPVFFSANMSIGVALLSALAQKATQVLGNGFDIEIVEKHHNQKLDAPSGTALMLADAIKGVREGDTEYVYERHSVRQKRQTEEIGISSVRGGTIVGEHEVIFAGHDEVITLTHTAQSKEIFAVGAVNAALFLQGRTPGCYAMADMMK